MFTDIIKYFDILKIEKNNLRQYSKNTWKNERDISVKKLTNSLTLHIQNTV